MTAQQRPTIRLQNIPGDLKAIAQWVVFETSPGAKGKLDKRPYTPGTRNLARSNDPGTWASFETAVEDAGRTGRYLGFCFTPDLGILFLDFDDVLGANGAVKAYAGTVIDTLDSYAEVSASGRGVHVFVRGTLPDGWSKDGVDGPVEVYPQAGGRFCLVTGERRPELGSLDGIIETVTTEQLAGFFPPRPRASSPRESRNGHHAADLADVDLATIIDALRPHRTPGQQHFLDLAIGGILAKNGIPETQALAVIDVLSGEEPKARATIRDSYKRAAANLDVRGYQALRDLVPGDALAIVDGVLARVWRSQQPRIVSTERGAKLAPAANDGPAGDVDHWPAPPPEVYHGWFGGYLDLVRETTEAPDQFHLAAALTIVGAWTNRKVYTKLASGRVYPNLYTVLVGLSSEAKKDTAMKRAWDAAQPPEWEREQAVLPFVERNSIASAESFIKGLTNNSNVVLRLSEFSEVLANARRKGTTTILTMLMKAWDNPTRLSNDSIANPAVAINPFVSILAGTQPDVLAADLINTDISSGFANRILFIPGSGKGPNPWPEEVDERALHAHWMRLVKHLNAYGTNEMVPVNRTPEVTALWERFYTAPRGETTIERTMSQRHQGMVLKIALIYALSDCSSVIDLVHLERAIAFINWQWACLRVLMGGWATSNDNRLSERILAVLRKHGPMRRRDLQRRTSDPRWSPNDFARMVRSMIESAMIATDIEGLIGIPSDE